MRNLNGDHFEVQLFVTFEFTMAEADRFLQAKVEDRPGVLNELLRDKHPLPETSTYNATDPFPKAVATALMERRERELKQLADAPPEKWSTLV